MYLDDCVLDESDERNCHANRHEPEMPWLLIHAYIQVATIHEQNGPAVSIQFRPPIQSPDSLTARTTEDRHRSDYHQRPLSFGAIDPP